VRPPSEEYAAQGPAAPTTWLGLFGLTAMAGSLPVWPGGVIVTTWAPGAGARRPWAPTEAVATAASAAGIESRAMNVFTVISLYAEGPLQRPAVDGLRQSFADDHVIMRLKRSRIVNIF
jgi:hypothetical protein